MSQERPSQARLSQRFADAQPVARFIAPDPLPDARQKTSSQKPLDPPTTPPVSVNFIGTVFHDSRSVRLGDDARQRRDAARQRQAQDNADCLAEAVSILSESPTGRDLLTRMTAQGYRIVFDDRRTGDKGAGGLCDPIDKLLILKSHDDPQYLALLIGHESVHALQNSLHDIFPSTRHRPDVGIKMSFAIEADAYAQQALIALELAHGVGTGKPMAGPLEEMRGKFPGQVKAAEAALKKAMSSGQTAQQAIEGGTPLLAAFEAFYDNFALRNYYEDAHGEWVREIAPRMKALSRLQKPFTQDTPSAQLKNALRHRGIAYLEKMANGMDFNDARYSGVTAETADAIRKIYADYLQGNPVPDIKIYGKRTRYTPKSAFRPPAKIVPEDIEKSKDPPTAARSALRKPVNKNLKPVADKDSVEEEAPKIKAPRKRKRDFW